MAGVVARAGATQTRGRAVDMTRQRPFVERCGLASATRADAQAQLLQRVKADKLHTLRLCWCDLHGQLRSKHVQADALAHALAHGVSMVNTLLLKDLSDRTAWPVFEANGTPDWLGLSGGGNVRLVPDPERLHPLPWAPGHAWLWCQTWHDNGQPVALDTRTVLQHQVQALHAMGLNLRVGLEVEFHVYRVLRPAEDPQGADWPGLPPEVALLHPGYRLLCDDYADACEPVLGLIQRTAQQLQLPLQSLEIEMGPSQFEAVFAATDALTAADDMVRFRHGIRQALARHGYHVTFVCRPPFAHVMASGWHVHQSLYHADSEQPVAPNRPSTGSGSASDHLGTQGAQWLAGLLQHAPALAALCVPSANGYARFVANALAPTSICWGLDNRGAMLRVLGADGGGTGARIENRLPEPAANPYVVLAAQIAAGMGGIAHSVQAPPASESPYASAHRQLPATQADALHALLADDALAQRLGENFVRYYATIKQMEVARHAAATDARDYDLRHHFARY